VLIEGTIENLSNKEQTNSGFQGDILLNNVKVMLKVEPAVNNGLGSPIEERFDLRFKFVPLVVIATKVSSVLLPLNCSSVNRVQYFLSGFLAKLKR